MAELHSSRMAQKVTSLCIDLLGGYGFTRKYPVEKFYPDSKIGTI
jgi:short/branched chain acyl-CoA dehydrogenase